MFWRKAYLPCHYNFIINWRRTLNFLVWAILGGLIGGIWAVFNKSKKDKNNIDIEIVAEIITDKKNNINEKAAESIKEIIEPVSEPFCPYCQNVLETKPQRKKKCPHCDNFIFVRSLPSGEKKVLLTEDEAKQVELEWDKLHSKKRCMEKLARYDVEEKDFNRRKKELSKKIAQEAEDRDVLWSLLNELIQKNIEDFRLLSFIYYDLADIVNKEGKDSYTFLHLAQKMVIMDMQKSSIVKGVEIVSCGSNSCEVCQQLNGKRFTIKEALEKMPLPIRECTHKQHNDVWGYCRCCYVAWTNH